MERLSRELLGAAVCLVAGPSAALAALWLAAPALLARVLSAPDVDAGIAATMVALLTFFGIAAIAWFIGTLIGLVLTGSPRPAVAFVASALLTPLWLCNTDPPLAGWAWPWLWAGVVPAVVRLVLGLIGGAGSPPLSRGR
jgi:hypothetical protein